MSVRVWPPAVLRMKTSFHHRSPFARRTVTERERLGERERERERESFIGNNLTAAFKVVPLSLSNFEY